MAARLGQVLYILSIVAAIIIGLNGLFIVVASSHPIGDRAILAAFFGFGPVVVVWIFGRAALYIFSGD